MKKSKIAAIVLAVCMVISLAAFIITKNSGSSEQPATATDQVFTLAGSEYTAKLTYKDAGGCIYMPTPVSGIYYTADLDNNIAFYEYASGAFTASPAEVKSVKVNMSASTESIPVTIKYIVVNGFTIGYGVFTPGKDSSVDLYDFAFAELRSMPSGYGSSYLILTDYDKEDFYKTDKTYNEIYEYDLKASSVSTKLSQNTRLIDHNGTYRQDWSMMSDEFIASMGSAKYFMSSRYYTEAETGERTDIMAYSTAYRPTIIAEDIIGYWFVNDDNGIHYLTKTDDGFEAVTVKDKKTKTTAEFDGDYFDGYLRSGNYLLNKTTGIVTNLLTGDTSSFSGASLEDADIFSVNTDGTKAVVASYGVDNVNGVSVQQVSYAALDGSKATETYSEPLLFNEQCSFTWLDSSSCMSVRAISEDGNQTGSVIYTF